MADSPPATLSVPGSSRLDADAPPPHRHRPLLHCSASPELIDDAHRSPGGRTSLTQRAQSGRQVPHRACVATAARRRYPQRSFQLLLPLPPWTLRVAQRSAVCHGRCRAGVQARGELERNDRGSVTDADRAIGSPSNVHRSAQAVVPRRALLVSLVKPAVDSHAVAVERICLTLQRSAQASATELVADLQEQAFTLREARLSADQLFYNLHPRPVVPARIYGSRRRCAAMPCRA